MRNYYENTINNFKGMNEDDREKFLEDIIEKIKNVDISKIYKKSNPVSHIMTPQEKQHDQKIINDTIHEIIKTGNLGMIHYE